MALNSGEDYELLFTVRPHKAAVLAAARPADFPPFTDVGEITIGRQVRRVDADGRPRPLPPAGYDHFRVKSERYRKR